MGARASPFGTPPIERRRIVFRNIPEAFRRQGPNDKIAWLILAAIFVGTLCFAGYVRKNMPPGPAASAPALSPTAR